MMKTDRNDTERLTLTIAEASEALNLSKAKTYMLVNTGRLPAIRISPRRIIVPMAALMGLLENEVSKGVSNED